MLNLRDHIPNKLPGRHRCECQARVHKLIRNCQGCGRIVCEQEDSGPCVFCGKFVCTREEKNIIENDKKQGLNLERQLMKNAGFGSDMSRLKQEEEAKQYRDMLLKADRESIIRNRVYDLDSDYYTIETTNFLTDQEKRAIQRRKDELKRQSQNRAKRRMVIELDFESGTVKETEAVETLEKYEDPEIQRILRAAEERQAKQSTASYKLRDPNMPTARKFEAKYNPELSTTTIPAVDQFQFADVYVDKDQAYAEVARHGYYVSFPQPLASSIASGKKWYIPVNEEITVEGPVYVVSRQSEKEVESNLPEFSLIGKVILANCITMADFHEEYPDIDEHSTETFVLIFEDPIELETPLPHVTSKLFGELPKSIREILNM